MFKFFKNLRLAIGFILLGSLTLAITGCGQGTDNPGATNEGETNTSSEDPFPNAEDYAMGFNWGQQAAANNPFRQSGRERCTDLWTRSTGKENVDATKWMEGCLDGFSGSEDGSTATTPDSGGQVIDETKQYYDDGYQYGSDRAWDANALKAVQACEPVNSYQDNEDWGRGCAKGFADTRKSYSYKAHMKERYDVGFSNGYENGPTAVSSTPEESCEIDMGGGATGELEAKEQFRGCIAGINKWRQDNPS